MTDPWDELVAQLPDLATPEESSVRDLTLSEILYEIEEIDEKLEQRRELLYPQTPEGRDLHSRRGALVIEKHRRLGSGH